MPFTLLILGRELGVRSVKLPLLHALLLAVPCTRYREGGRAAPAHPHAFGYTRLNDGYRPRTRRPRREARATPTAREPRGLTTRHAPGHAGRRGRHNVSVFARGSGPPLPSRLQQVLAASSASVSGWVEAKSAAMAVFATAAASALAAAERSLCCAERSLCCEERSLCCEERSICCEERSICCEERSLCCDATELARVDASAEPPSNGRCRA